MLEDRIHHSHQPRNKQNDQGMQQEILVMGLKSHFCAVPGNLPEMWLLNQRFGQGGGMDLRSWVVGLCWLRKAETWLCRGDFCRANSSHVPEHKPCHRLSSALMVKLDRNTRFTGKGGENDCSHKQYLKGLPSRTEHIFSHFLRSARRRDWRLLQEVSFDHGLEARSLLPAVFSCHFASFSHAFREEAGMYLKIRLL